MKDRMAQAQRNWGWGNSSAVSVPRQMAFRLRECGQISSYCESHIPFDKMKLHSRLSSHFSTMLFYRGIINAKRLDLTSRYTIYAKHVKIWSDLLYNQPYALHVIRCFAQLTIKLMKLINVL